MSRVNHLGEIDARGKYEKSPEPPTFLSYTQDAGEAIRTLCARCEIGPDLRFVDDEMTPIRGTIPYVTLERESFVTMQTAPTFYPGDPLGTITRINSAYIGQCPRCKRIYVARIR